MSSNDIDGLTEWKEKCQTPGQFLNQRNEDKRTPFHIVCIRGTFDVIHFFIDNYKDFLKINELDRYGQTSIHVLAE